MIEAVAEVLALSLACWAGYKSISRRPDYNWKHIFQRALGVEDVELSILEDQPAPLLTWKEMSSEKFTTYINRKFTHLILFDMGGGFGEPFAKLGQIRHYPGPHDEKSIAENVEKKSDRLVFFAEGKETMTVLKMLHKWPGMRDCLFAVVLIDPQVDEEWMRENFTQEGMDAEINHAIPYFLLSHAAEELAEIIEPPTPSSGWRSIELIDLRTMFNGIEWKEKSLALWVLMGKL